MIRKVAVLVLSAIIMLSFTACSGKNAGEKADESVKTADISEMDFSIKEISVDKSIAKEYVLSASENTIKKSGVYKISGTSHSTITVDVGGADITLILNGVSIETENGPAVYIKSADNCVIYLESGTENRLSDSQKRENSDDASSLDAALFSRSDLFVTGGGTLTVDGNYKHGIVSKDDLTVLSGNLCVTAENVGICGKDCIKTAGGSIRISAGTDGIRSDNSEDKNRGFVYLKGGNFDITSGNDGIQAETVLKAEDCKISINAGDGSTNSLKNSDESHKGMKAASDILISGGDFSVNSEDDCIHSNGSITISGGVLNLSSGDDGIHADTDLSVSGGNIKITKSYEGIEANKIVISGGETVITASDDGINSAGGKDGSSLGERFGRGNFNADDENGGIVITGGYNVVNASGDGIDSNSTVNISGGVTLISGPTSNGDAAFDYEISASVSGGVLVALGSGGMAENFTSADNQGAFLVSFNTEQGKTPFAVCNESGTVIVSFTPEKSYSCALVTAPKITEGNTYTVITGGTADNADNYGYSEGSVLSGGESVAAVEMTSSLYGSGGMGDKNGRGDMGGPDGTGGPNGAGGPDGAGGRGDMRGRGGEPPERRNDGMLG